MAEILSGSQINAQNGGLFISKGMGRHPARVMDSWEIILVKKGCLEITQGGENFPVKKHQAIILHPGVPHAGTADYLPELEFYWLHFMFNTAASNNIPTLVNPQRPQRVEELFREFLNNQLSPFPCQVTANCLVTLMLCELFKPVSTNDNLSPSATNLARRAHNHIRLNIDKKLTPGSVADSLSCNVDYLSRIFKAYAGKGLTDIIRHEKMISAKENLCNTTLPIKTIAENLGFDDAGYFRKVFREFEGMTPGQYRLSHTSLKINTK